MSGPVIVVMLAVNGCMGHVHAQAGNQDVMWVVCQLNWEL